MELTLMLKRKPEPPALTDAAFDWKSHALDLRAELARARREKQVLYDAVGLARGYVARFTPTERRRFEDLIHQLEGDDHVVRCPHCHATRNFLTEDDGSMMRVLEDASDTDLLEEGRALVCEHCGECFLCPAAPVASAD